MSQALTIVQKKRDLAAVIQQNAAQILACTQFRDLVSVERYQAALMLMIDKVPRIADCTPVSLIRCLYQASEMGLELGGSRGASIIPFGNEAVFIPHYQQFIDMALDHPNMKDIKWAVVFKGDKFEFEYGTSPFIRHTPCGNSNWQDIEAVWVFWKYHTGEDFLVVSRERLEQLRKFSKQQQGEAWANNPIPMYAKAAIRQASKHWRFADKDERACRLSLALAYANYLDTGDASVAQFKSLEATPPGFEVATETENVEAQIQAMSTEPETHRQRFMRLYKASGYSSNETMLADVHAIRGDGKVFSKSNPATEEDYEVMCKNIDFWIVSKQDAANQVLDTSFVEKDEEELEFAIPVSSPMGSAD